MGSNASQLGSHERIYKMKSPVEPGEKLVLDLVMQRERHLGARGPDLGELDQSHDIEIPAGRFKRELVWRIAFHRQQNSARFKAERSPETKIHGLGGSDRGLRHHHELPAIGLDAREAVFALIERLIHVQSFL